MANAFKILLFLAAFFVFGLSTSCSSYKQAAVAPKADSPKGSLNSLEADYEDEEIKVERRIFEEPDPSLVV